MEKKTRGRQAAISIPARVKRNARNRKTDTWSSEFFTTTNVEPQRIVQNIGRGQRESESSLLVGWGCAPSCGVAYLSCLQGKSAKNDPQKKTGKPDRADFPGKG